MLEHLEAILGPYIDHIKENILELSCLLSLIENTTTMAGWLGKSIFQYSEEREKGLTEVNLSFSQSYTFKLLNNRCIDNSQ